MLTKGEKMLQDMHLLWYHKWIKMNGKWHDPVTKKEYSREEAVRLVNSRIRKQWIKNVSGQSSEALHTGQN